MWFWKDNMHQHDLQYCEEILASWFSLKPHQSCFRCYHLSEIVLIKMISDLHIAKSNHIILDLIYSISEQHT